MGIQEIEIVAYRAEYGLELVKMWRQSFQRSMSLKEQNCSEALNGQLDFFCSINPSSIQVAIDRSSSTVAGFMVLASGALDHLYVNVDYQGLGLGTTLLNQAKVLSPHGIELYTFQKNVRAQTFYESRGFSEIERGFAELESNPWAETREELADIKYGWAALSGRKNSV